MKTIEERARKYVEPLYGIEHYSKSDEFYSNFFDGDEIYSAFCDGAESEHEELTRWNSPDNAPDNDRQILLKVKTNFVGKVYYKIGSFIDGDYCESHSGKPLRVELLGWREIYE